MQVLYNLGMEAVEVTYYIKQAHRKCYRRKGKVYFPRVVGLQKCLCSTSKEIIEKIYIKTAHNRRRCRSSTCQSLKKRKENCWSYRRMAENGFAPPPLGNFADISFLVEN